MFVDGGAYGRGSNGKSAPMDGGYLPHGTNTLAVVSRIQAPDHNVEPAPVQLLTGLTGVGGKRHEDDVLMAALLYLPARNYAKRIGIQDNLQKNSKIVRKGTFVVVPVSFLEYRKNDFFIDQTIEGVLESTGQNLLIEMNSYKLTLTI